MSLEQLCLLLSVDQFTLRNRPNDESTWLLAHVISNADISQYPLRVRNACVILHCPIKLSFYEQCSLDV